jgi:hypothetical protein
MTEELDHSASESSATSGTSAVRQIGGDYAKVALA